MSARTAFVSIFLLSGAIASWYLAQSLTTTEPAEPARSNFESGYYFKNARILGTGPDGQLLYEIRADYARQQEDQAIKFEQVQINYSESASVPWTIDAESATISDDQQQIKLSGNVRALSTNGFSGKDTEITTQFLQLEPATFSATTDQRVQIRIGERKLMATGMLASLQENKLELQSNISGKFTP